MNTRCEPYRLMMLDSISGLLEAGRCEELRWHLDDCADCRARYALLQGDDALLTGLTEAMQGAISRIETATLDALGGRVETPRPIGRPKWGARIGGYLRVAVVIAVVCLVMVLVPRVVGPLGVSTVSLAQTLEAMHGMSWVHTLETSSAEPTVTRESWECFDPHIVAHRTPAGPVEYVDYGRNAAYRYNPNSNKIVVSLTTDDYLPAGPRTPFEMLSRMIDSAADKGNQIVRQPLLEGDRHRERIQILFSHNPYCESMTLVRDVQTNLLVRMEAVEIRGQARPVRITTFDYPQPGPADIYALGVPRDATIFDTRPEGPALALIAEVQRRFERGLGDHLAVVLESWVGEDGTLEPCKITVLRQKGTLKRSDHYHAFNFQSNPLAPATLYPQIKDAWPSLTILQVLALESDAPRERQMLFDGHRTLSRFVTAGRIMTAEHPTDQFKTLSPGSSIDSLTSLLWPNLHLEMQSDSSHFKREIRLLAADPNRPGLVGLQSAGFAETTEWWFDPGKDYMLTERISQRQGTSAGTCIVTQAQQTPSGRWYPAVVRRESTTIRPEGRPQTSRSEERILLDPNPVFEEGIFAAAGLGR